jgi:serine/threonine protein kinase
MGATDAVHPADPILLRSPADTLPPELVDHSDYEIVRELGRGGMRVIYLAKNKLMKGRPEVLKFVGRHLLDRPSVLDRFLREIRSTAMLHHANIVTAYSTFRLGDSLVLAMEYLEGLDLAKVVKYKGPLPIANACYFIHQAALGLQHAHERGMVHRDIKPAHLMLARDGKKAVVKVLDFGLAKVTREGQTDSGLAREGQLLVTPDYIAPEQIRNAQSADIRADIYSLGCTFYYLLTGGPPFRDAHLWDIYQAHFSMEARPLNLVRTEVPVELAAVVAKMMSKEPERRFQTPAEVAQALVPFFKRTGAVANVTTQA